MARAWLPGECGPHGASAKKSHCQERAESRGQPPPTRALGCGSDYLGAEELADPDASVGWPCPAPKAQTRTSRRSPSQPDLDGAKSSHRIIAAIYDARGVPGQDMRDHLVFPKILHRKGGDAQVRRVTFPGTEAR